MSPAVSFLITWTLLLVGVVTVADFIITRAADHRYGRERRRPGTAPGATPGGHERVRAEVSPD